MDEGYIKFNYEWIKDKSLPVQEIEELNHWRNKLYNLGLIGSYIGGIGFGNISIRFKDYMFVINGSSTGNIKRLDENHHTLVTSYNFLENRLTCKGPIMVSSESLSHAMIYECSEANAVIHVHNLYMWESLINKIPTTDRNVPYGTPEIANEIRRLFESSNLHEEKILVMGGHKEGIISFGKTLDEAGETLLSKLD